MVTYVSSLVLSLRFTDNCEPGPAAFWNDDSHYVSLGSRHGYYIVRPDSQLFRQLGLYEAPVIDTADPLRHGYGADALAFEFNRKGVLDVGKDFGITRERIRQLQNIALTKLRRALSKKEDLPEKEFLVAA